MSKLQNPTAGAPILKCEPLSSVIKREVTWLWKDRIPANTLTLLEGDGGRGKSSVIAEICSRLSTGENLRDDDTEREPKRILLLAAEDDPACVLRPRFEANQANLDNVLFDDQAMILNPNGLEALTKAIREHLVDVVVIDPIVSFLGQKIDMNKGNDVRSVLGPLVKLGRDLNCTFIVIRHFNKNREGSASQRGAGSVDFRNAARSVLQIIHSEEKNYLALEKSNYAGKAKTLSFTISNGRVLWGESSDLTADQLHNENQNSGESKSALDEAIAFIKDELFMGPRPAKDITRLAKEMNIAEKTLTRAKNRIGAKSVKNPSGWVWQWTPEHLRTSQDGQGGQESPLRLNRNLDHVDHLERERRLQSAEMEQ